MTRSGPVSKAGTRPDRTAWSNHSNHRPVRVADDPDQGVGCQEVEPPALLEAAGGSAPSRSSTGGTMSIASTTPTSTTPTSSVVENTPPLDDDDALTHGYCPCDENRALCGTDLTGARFVPDDHTDDSCVVCVEMVALHQSCPSCGKRQDWYW